MKNLVKLSLLAILFIAFSCKKDDDGGTPEEVNEEEVITTVLVVLTSGSDTVTLSYVDIDGDGPGEAVLSVTGSLQANTTYQGAITFTNATENPPEDITAEINEEDDEHQVFYLPGSGLNATFNYENFDGDGNPLGTLFSVDTGDASEGSLNIVLRHEPNKPNDGTLADAGGETDISVLFDGDNKIVIE